tara:strand:- start:1271 stop:1504 length:234 start_codon:yes stop_codon:yes gene_type:complete
MSEKHITCRCKKNGGMGDLHVENGTLKKVDKNTYDIDDKYETSFFTISALGCECYVQDNKGKSTKDRKFKSATLKMV